VSAATSPSARYVPVDQLYLWWLASPNAPVLVGDLNVVRAHRGVSLRYASEWVARGFSLSEDLPVSGGTEFFPTEPDSAVGSVDDARPDRWGERVIRLIDKPARLSLLEYLYFAGDDRFGALGVSLSRERYLPRAIGPLPILKDAEAIHEIVRKVLEGEPVAERERRLITPGVTLGGAKPKALIQMDDAPWVIKFSDGDAVDTPLIEHATMTLAAKVGIRVAETKPLRLTYGHAIAIKRFDRAPHQRRHALSAHVALKAAGERMGYPELAQLLRRRGTSQPGEAIRQMHELFRRMVFNILVDNTDDHEKNHALLVTDAEQYELSPAYDVLPSGQALGYQQMRVGESEADATLENALSMCKQFALKKPEAEAEVRAVATVVATWRVHFKKCGVTANDIAALEEQIDRPFLREQRDAAYIRRTKAGAARRI
jgi:serine/threonine-protein kinase HipA